MSLIITPDHSAAPRIQQLLDSKNLGMIYVHESGSGNGMLDHLWHYYSSQQPDDDDNDFSLVLTSSSLLQAGVFYENRTIFVSTGLFNAICKIADAIMAQLLRRENRYWSLISPLEYQDEGITIADGQITVRATIKLLLIHTLFNFILQHERGHMLNGHGNRERVAADFEMKTAAMPVSREEAMHSQARELVADHYATVNFKYGNLLTFEELLGNDEERDFFSYTLAVAPIISYFRMMAEELATSGWDTSTHPDWALRAERFFACLSLGRPQEEKLWGALTPELLYSLTLVNDVFEQLGYDTGEAWLVKESSAAENAWVEQVLNAVPEWSGRP